MKRCAGVYKADRVNERHVALWELEDSVFLEINPD